MNIKAFIKVLRVTSIQKKHIHNTYIIILQQHHNYRSATTLYINLAFRIIVAILFDPLTAILCPSLTAPSNGMLSQPSRAVGSAATYRCDAGFMINGISTLICGNTGAWSGVAPTCKCEEDDIYFLVVSVVIHALLHVHRTQI